jgi:hypothetical protein
MLPCIYCWCSGISILRSCVCVLQNRVGSLACYLTQNKSEKEGIFPSIKISPVSRALPSPYLPCGKKVTISDRNLPVTYVLCGCFPCTSFLPTFCPSLFLCPSLLASYLPFIPFPSFFFPTFRTPILPVPLSCIWKATRKIGNVFVKEEQAACL